MQVDSVYQPQGLYRSRLAAKHLRVSDAGALHQKNSLCRNFLVGAGRGARRAGMARVEGTKETSRETTAEARKPRKGKDASSRS